MEDLRRNNNQVIFILNCCSFLEFKLLALKAQLMNKYCQNHNVLICGIEPECSNMWN